MNAPYLCAHVSADGYAVPCGRFARFGRVHSYASGRRLIVRACADHAEELEAGPASESGQSIEPQRPAVQFGETPDDASPDDCAHDAFRARGCFGPLYGPWYVCAQGAPVLGPFGTGAEALTHRRAVETLAQAETTRAHYWRFNVVQFADGFEPSPDDVARIARIAEAMRARRAAEAAPDVARKQPRKRTARTD